MESIKMKGKTVEEAVNSALEVLKLGRDQAEVKVLSEGKEGLLGVFGGEEAEVEVSLKESPGEKGKRLLQEILDKIGLLTIVSLVKEGEEEVYLEIKGEDMGRIIGKEGATLEALGYLVGMMITRSFDRRIRAIVEAGDYRKRKTERLEKVAEEAIIEVERTGKEVVLPPMPAADRREVHIAVKESGKATSFSRGERAERHIVVAPMTEGEDIIEEGEKTELPRGNE